MTGKSRREAILDCRTGSSKRLSKLLVGVAALSLLLIQKPAHAKDPVVVLNTTKGPIVIRVFMSYVPYTAGNFMDLVSRGFYSNAVFHRIENWCIQGGDPSGTGHGGFVDPQTGQPRHIRLEINRRLSHNSAGVVAMARTSNPNSASCQFYITKSPCPWLDGNYAIFGGVLDGMRAVMSMQRGDRIVSAQIVDAGGADAPPPTSSSPSYPNSSQSPPPSGGSSSKPLDSGF